MKEYKYTINGNKYEVEIGDIVDNIAAVKVNGEDFKVEMEPEAEPEKKKVVLGKASAPAANDNAEGASPANVNTNNAIKAPLPGTIIEVKVAVGDEVQPGDVVVVLEAMKMANNLEAEKGGKVTAVLVQQGQSVMEDDALVVIE